MIEIETDNYVFKGKDIFFLLTLPVLYGLMIVGLYYLSGVVTDALLTKTASVEDFKMAWTALIIIAVIELQFLISAIRHCLSSYKKNS